METPRRAGVVPMISRRTEFAEPSYEIMDISL